MRFIKRNKVILIFILSAITVSFLIYIKINLLKENDYNEIKESEKVIIKEDKPLEDNKEKIITISVDVKGAVTNPGVYQIDNNKKVIDAINMAGGLLENADTTFINLAKKVTDEMTIIIYTKEEIEKAIASEDNKILSRKVDNVCECPIIKNDACLYENTISNTETKSNTNKNKNTSNNSTSSKTDKVNINTATQEELQTLTGIGASKAQAIIDYRNEFGNFKTIEDIKNVSGIGDSAYEKIKDNITV